MMKRDDCFEALKRHITDEIVVATYTSAADWIVDRAARAELFLDRRHGACLLACARHWRSAARTGAWSCSTATAAS